MVVGVGLFDPMPTNMLIPKDRQYSLTGVLQRFGRTFSKFNILAYNFVYGPRLAPLSHCRKPYS